MREDGVLKVDGWDRRGEKAKMKLGDGGKRRECGGDEMDEHTWRVREVVVKGREGRD